MSPYSRQHQALALVACLLLTGLAAALGAVASANAASFYAQLSQPSWAPPASVFGPVWTLLYLLMGIAAWLAWRVGPRPGRRRALGLFSAQLAVNALWSWLFFAWHRGAFALADILLLCILLVATLLAFWRQRPLAGALLLPYLAWVAFAAALNAAIWSLNPQLLS
ncbi:TspO/MBR family protein [Solimonas sp. SE-A11]|uniref:TspO/MBR family protein n=1 Tax=Solimonas sp. SE-A11 TaxID=3054954 RepID=UPI00259C6B05|nr:TspO/MBR family protein [Solimonas sp. SE-A11]MDM4772732.1 TspO/MBR family protein [Solimonas sp. SE-A11]